MKKINVSYHENHINSKRLNRFLSFFALAIIALLPFNLAKAVTVTLTTGTSWTCPSGVTSMTIECWGAGGGGGGATSNTARAGGGGAGGSYSRTVLGTVSAGAYTYSIGTGGTAGGTSAATSPGGVGGNTTITIGGTTVTAVGGAGGGGGQSGTNVGIGGAGSSTGCVGTITNAGGSGATGVASTRSGGGGGAAGFNGVGGTASASAVTGGVAAGPIGGNGADGKSAAGVGTVGTAPGGGGSGGFNNAKTGGAGGAGQIIITYTLGNTAPSVTTTSATSLSTTGATFNGNITADGGASITDRGFCYKTSSAVLITDNFTSEAGTTTGTYTKAITGLAVNTQYFYKAYATNSVGTTLSATEISFYTLADVPDAPTLSGASQTFLSVAVNSSTNPATTQYAIYETTTSKFVQANGTLGASAVWQTAATWGTKQVTGLTENTQYTFEVKARNTANTETAYGSTASLSTLPNTSPLLSVGSITAFGSQCVNSTGGPNSFTISGSNLTTADITVASLSGFTYSTVSDGTYTSTLSLSQGGGTYGPTTIYVKFTPTAVQSYNGDIVVGGAGATSVNRSVTGSGINTAATVTTTSPATSITATTVTLSGNVTDAGCQSVTARGICYGASLNPDLSGSFTSESGSTGSYSSNVTGLAANTLYHFRAYVTTSAGTSFGSDVTFTTSGLSAPTATAATGTSSTGFTANWNAVDGATGYKLDVATNPVYSLTNKSENFVGCTLGTPAASNATDISGSLNTYLQTTGWTGQKIYQAGGTVRIGATSTMPGIIITPTVDLSGNSGNATLTFDVYRYSTGDAGNFEVYHAPDGSTYSLVGSAMALPVSNTNVQFNITNGTANSKIKITGTANSANRFILDNIVVSQNTMVAGYGDLTVNSTSQSVTGLSPNTTYYYRVRATSANSTSTSSTQEISVTTTRLNATLSVSGTQSFTYNGSAQGPATISYDGDGTASLLYTSTDGGGYSSATAPTNVGEYQVVASATQGATYNAATSSAYAFAISSPATVTVIANANLSSYSPSSATDVTVSSGELTVDENATVKTMTVAPGAKLALVAGKTLTVVGALTLQSDATGNATFVDNGGTISAGSTNVEQYLTSGRNWYVSSPVSGATAAVFNPAGLSNLLYSYDEAHGSTAPWPTISNNATGLSVMKGYVANMASSGVVTFSGSLNTGAQEIVVNRTAGQTKEGFNLVGNPYPSYLDWSNVTKTNLLTTMWYRTKTTPAPITGATVYTFDTYNATGNLATSNGAKAVTNMIPPMQAFWVRVDAGQISGTFAVTNTQRAHADNSSNTFKAKATLEAQPVLRLEVSNGTNSDQALIYYNATASNGFDSYDSPKLSNESVSTPEIYTLAGSEQLVINGVNDATELALGFTTGEANNFSIKASQFANFASGTQIILRDNLLNYEQDLTLGDYKFYSDVTANNETRFTVLFKAPSVATGINPNSNGNVWISLANNQIVVNGANAGTSVAVYNEVGQRLVSQRLTATTKSVGSFVPGVYMVTITNAGKSATQKVIIK